MKYKINWCEKKTGKSGKEYMVMHLRVLDEKGEEGEEIQNVSGFELSYAPGMEIEGEIVQNGNYKNWRPKLEAPEFIKKGNPNFRTQQIEKAQATKASYIEKAQNAKEDSIMWSSCCRDATLLTIATKDANMSDDDVKSYWEHWRKWLLERWNDDSKDIINPF